MANIERNDKTHAENVKVVGDHPEAISPHLKMPKTPNGEDMEKFISNVEQDVLQIKSDSNVWKERQIMFYKRRQGIRPVKNWPFRNCSNSSMMTEDKIINKMNAPYYNMLFSPSLVANFIHDPESELTDFTDDNLQLNSKVLDHIVRNKMTKTKQKMYNLIDQMHQTGKGIVKITYEYKTEDQEYLIDIEEMEDHEKAALMNLPGLRIDGKEEFALTLFIYQLLRTRGAEFEPGDEKFDRQVINAIKDLKKGEQVIKFSIPKVISQAPKFTIVKMEDIEVHGYFNDIQSATMISHTMRWTPNDLRKAIQGGLVDKEAGEAILNKYTNPVGSDYQTDVKSDSSTKDELDSVKEEAHGSNHYHRNDGLIEVREVCLYADPDSSGVLKKCVLLYASCYKDRPLSFKRLPYNDGKWPYVNFNNEETLDGWLASRGIPHKISPFSTGIDNKYNQRNDSVAVTVAPMFEYVQGDCQLGKVEFRPGQGVPVSKIGSVKPFNLAVGDTASLFREQNLLQYMAEDYMSSPDFTATDPNAPSAQAKTATEVVNRSQDRNNIFSVRLDLVNEPWKECLTMAWSRHMQFGPDNLNMTIEDASTGTKEQKVWSKAIGRMKAFIIPAGSFEHTNTLERIRNSKEMLALSKDPLYGPMLKPYNILKELVSSLNPKRSDYFMHNRQQYQEQLSDLQKKNAENQAQQEQKALAVSQLEHRQNMELEIAKIREKGKADIKNTLAKESVDRAVKMQEEMENIKGEPKNDKENTK